MKTGHYDVLNVKYLQKFTLKKKKRCCLNKMTVESFRIT